MLSKKVSSTIFEVWCDLGLNPGLPDHWRTLYPLGQWAGSSYTPHNSWPYVSFCPWRKGWVNTLLGITQKILFVKYLMSKNNNKRILKFRENKRFYKKLYARAVPKEKIKISCSGKREDLDLLMDWFDWHENLPRFILNHKLRKLRLFYIYIYCCTIARYGYMKRT